MSMKQSHNVWWSDTAENDLVSIMVHPVDAYFYS